MHAIRHSDKPVGRLPRRAPAPLLLAALAVWTLLLVPAPMAAQADWRLQILDAAVVQGAVVRLGEIARPLGQMDEATWRELAATELFPAPGRRLKPMSISSSKLAAALEKYMGAKARYCILPNSIALQRGGDLVRNKDLVSLVVNTLTPMAAKMGGDPEFRDFRLPEYAFLRDPTHQLRVELAGTGLRPGRVSLRLREVAMDDSVQRTMTGSVYVDLWRSVPVAARPLNRGDEVSDATISRKRKNVAYLRGDIWDGTGGPWRMKTTAGKGQVLYKSDLEPLPLITKGDMVRLIFRGDNIRLEVPAEAMGDGGYEQSIPVRNMQSQVQVYARVIDSQTVQAF